MIGPLQTMQVLSLVSDGMPVEQIAQSLDIDVSVVKLVVARHDQTGDRDITDQDLRLLRAHAVELALNAEDVGVQARMTQYLLDRDKPKKQEAAVSPIVAINQALHVMNVSYNEMVKAYKPVSETDDPQ